MMWFKLYLLEPQISLRKISRKYLFWARDRFFEVDGFFKSNRIFFGKQNKDKQKLLLKTDKQKSHLNSR